MRILPVIVVLMLTLTVLPMATVEAVPITAELKAGAVSAGLGNVTLCDGTTPVPQGYLLEVRDAGTHDVWAEFVMGEGTNVGPPTFLPRDGNFEVIFGPDGSETPMDVYFRAYNHTNGSLATSYGDSATVTVTGSGEWLLNGWSLCTVQVPRFDAAVTAGWNLLSYATPIDGPLHQVINDTLGDGTTSWDRVFAYRDDAGDREWLSWDASRPSWANSLDSVTWRDGLWIQVTAVGDGFLSFLGSPLEAGLSRSVLQGWNLAGYASPFSQTVAAATPGLDCPLIQGWNGTDLYQMLATDTLQAGQGQWFFCNTVGIWSL